MDTAHFLLVLLSLVGFILRSLACLARSGSSIVVAEEGAGAGGAEGSLLMLAATPRPDNTVSVLLSGVSLLRW